MPNAGRDQSVVLGAHAATRRRARWQRMAGIALWLIVMLPMIDRAIGVGQWHDNDFGGTFTALNIPGPKVWAVPLLQRSIGYEPGPLGVSSQTLALLNLAAIWLITVPAGERRTALRRTARWMAVVAVAMLLGMLLHRGSIRTDWWTQTKWFALAAVGVEITATGGVYLWLASVAAGLGRRALAMALVGCAVGAAGIIAASLPVLLASSYFKAHADDPPVQLYAAAYGALSVGLGLAMLLCVLRLLGAMWRQTWPAGSSVKTISRVRLATEHITRLCSQCGYDRAGLSPRQPCPECGHEDSVITHGTPSWQADRLQAWAVWIGLVGWLIVTPSLWWVVLMMDFRAEFGGAIPLLNYPGPKVWAVTALQRSVGRQPEFFGTFGATRTLINLVMIWLITWPGLTDEGAIWRNWRLLGRWLAALGTGAFLSFTMVSRYLEVYQPGFWKWVFAGVLAAELPATVLIYLYLAQAARALRQQRVARTLVRVAWVAGVLMLVSLMILPVGAALEDMAGLAWASIFFAVYGAVAVGASMSAMMAMAQLAAAVWRYGRLPAVMGMVRRVVR